VRPSIRPAVSQSAAAVAVDWKGTARYSVISCLGQGGMGAVYEAWDRERGQPVALKTLLNFTPATLYLFKQEFRTLADVSHPNLVRLDELVMSGSDHIFFAMELVRGTDFLSHVYTPDSLPESRRPGPIGDESRTRVADQVQRVDLSHDLGPAAASSPQPGRRRSPADLDRLRPALCQLVDGVMALHAARKLHRDIKPSNVLVTPEGRIVLLDFGVATEFARVVDEEMREEDQVAGTARYMAPEQAFEEPTPACDWYSVGVMLYEALVGRAPFVGSTLDVLTMKNSVDPLPPGMCVSGVPADLDALCVALLHREPARRPQGSEILRRLGRATSLPAPDAGSDATQEADDERENVGLVGRELHLHALRDAFEATRSGHTVTVRVGGRPGMGKSSLVHRFLDGLVERGAAVVLRGRAYEREAVPYKAFDSVIDSLSRYLMCLSDEDLTIALPKDTWALARLFPVLRRVPSIGALAEEAITDPQRVRRRAFLALRELLSSLSRRRPLVLFVDDAQWGDADSAALWLELVRPPHAPPILLAMTYRDEEAKTSPFLCELRAHWHDRAEMRGLTLGPLERADARHLALSLLGFHDGSAAAAADAIALESGGNPFLIEELARGVGLRARSMSRQEASAAFASVTLEQMVRDRLASLPDEARRMLEVVAVCGRPLVSLVASRAAGVAESADDVIALLRTRRFLHAGIRNGREVLEAVHARIGETIVAQLGPTRVREHHAKIARVLEATTDVDVEALAMHLLGAGDTERAAQFAERAAELAVEKLAFDEAARLLRLTLETHPASSPDGSRLRKRLGEVLEWAGRSAEAGRVYLEAAEGATALQKVDLQRTAAEQLYASGRMAEGTEVLHRVLTVVGARAPRSKYSALFWLIAYHVWLRLLGLRFRERDASEVRPEDRLRIDAIYAVTLAFSMVDHILCMSMRARVLVESLRAGDRLQVARAAAMVACDLGGDGPETKTELVLWEMAHRLADKENSPVAKLAVRSVRGVLACLRGHWTEAKQTLDPLASMVTNRRFALQSAVLFTLYSLYFLGELKELTQRYVRALAEAEDSGNVFMSANLRAIAGVPVWLAADDPEKARHELHEAAKWTEGRFSTQWRMAIFGADLDLYVGDGTAAYERVKGLRRALRKNIYLFVQYVRVLTAFAQARAAIASLDHLPPRARGRRLAEVHKLQRRLERERTPWTAGLAAIVRAGWLCESGDRAGAEAALRSAIERAEAAEMPIFAASARHRLGLLRGGDEGAALVNEAEDAMEGRGVQAPARFAAMLVPGRWTY
jgi:serine/threonine protein kinase